LRVEVTSTDTKGSIRHTYPTLIALATAALLSACGGGLRADDAWLGVEARVIAQ